MKFHILITEDDENVANGLSDILKSYGYQVSVSDNSAAVSYTHLDVYKRQASYMYSSNFRSGTWGNRLYFAGNFK